MTLYCKVLDNLSSVPYHPNRSMLPAMNTPREDLLYIRRTLDSAARLSSISGAATAVIGVLSLLVAAVNLRYTGVPWIQRGSLASFGMAWGLLLILSLAISAFAMERKAARTGQPFWSPVLRKALSVWTAPMITGAIMTAAIMRAGTAAMIPTVWLACYGAALAACGFVTVSPVRWMGLCFLILSVASLLLPIYYGLPLLALGFGGLHIAFGAYIAWRHDG